MKLAVLVLLTAVVVACAAWLVRWSRRLKDVHEPPDPMTESLDKPRRELLKEIEALKAENARLKREIKQK